MLNNYQRFLLSGGKGFIGQTLNDLLQNQGKVVKTLDTKDNQDVRDEQFIKETIVDFEPDIIISMASTAGIDRVEKDPIGCIETNVMGVSNLLKHKGNIKLVHLSTSEVYGDNADRNVETDPTLVGSIGSPRWSYQASKVCADHLIVNTDKEALIIRPFNVFGPKQEGHGAIADFIEWAKQGEDLKIYGDGMQERSWCSVYDFLEGVIALIENDCKGVYNVGDPNTIMTIRALAERIIAGCHSESKLYYVPKREVDIYYRVPNIDKITKDTRWKPKRSFCSELNKTISYRI